MGLIGRVKCRGAVHAHRCHQRTVSFIKEGEALERLRTMHRRRKKYCPQCGDRVSHADYYCKHCNKRLRLLPLIVLWGLSISVVLAALLVLFGFFGNPAYKFN
jgi:hypothetical protein